MIRSLHFYTSAFVSVMILFYAVSGFLAMHADWLVGHQEAGTAQDLRTVPASALRSDEALEDWCHSLIEGKTRLEPGMHSGVEQWYVVRGVDSALQCIIDREAGTARLIRLRLLDEAAPAAHADLARSIGEDLGASVAADSLYHDAEYQTLHFSLNSVWFEAHISVFLDQELYSVEKRELPFIKSIVELHRGQHGNWFQTLLADLTAIALIFVAGSGVVMGMQMNKRRRMTGIALLVSLLLTIALMIGR